MLPAPAWVDTAARMLGRGGVEVPTAQLSTPCRGCGASPANGPMPVSWIFANRRSAILRHELAHVGANPRRTALDLLDLGNPDLNWVRIAQGFGVEAVAAADLGMLSDLLRASLSRRGPFLIELAVLRAWPARLRLLTSLRAVGKSFVKR